MMPRLKTVKLRPFADIIKENGHTNTDTSGNWMIYHPDVTKCLTVLKGQREYFGGVVTIWPNEKINTMIHRGDTYTTRKVYKAETSDGVIFDVYDHWFTDAAEHLPEDLFEI